MEKKKAEQKTKTYDASNERKPQLAEMSDEELKSITNYEKGNLTILDKNPGMRYFFAANDPKNPGRPDGIEACKQRGYRISETAHCPSGPADCVLMEIPMEKFLAFKELERRDNDRKMKAAMAPGAGGNDGLDVIKGSQHGVRRVQR